MTNRPLPPRLLLDIDRFLAAQPFHPCCLLVHPSTAHLRDLGHALAEHYGWPRVSLIDLLVEPLIDAPVGRRPSLARDEVLAAATHHAPGPVLLTDINLLFEPSLRLDPLRLFLDASRQARLIAAWPGAWSNSALAYAEPAHAHYRVWRNPELCPQCVIRV